MSYKKYLTVSILVFFSLFFSNKIIADIMPNDKFSASEVVEIQLMSLQSNSDQNQGIYQCWIFAHPNNKKYTGPFTTFVSMIKNKPYNILLNSKFFKIKVLSENKKKARIEVLLDSNNNRRYKIFWHLGKTTIDSKCQNCWMTLGVTQPFDMGVIY